MSTTGRAGGQAPCDHSSTLERGTFIVQDAVRILLADAYSDRSSATAALLETACVVAGAEVWRSGRSAGDVAQRRCIHPAGWVTAPVATRLELAAGRGLEPAPDVVIFVGDGPVAIPAQTNAALREHTTARMWVNCAPDLAVTTGSAATSEVRILAALGAVEVAGSEVEIAAPRPYVVLPRISRLVGALPEVLTRLLRVLRVWGVRIVESKVSEASLHSFAVLELLDLPVALCGTTLEVFLATAAGRSIARQVLREGLNVARRQRQPLARLPIHDPQRLSSSRRDSAMRTSDAAFGAVREAEFYSPSTAFNRLTQALHAGVQPLPVSANQDLVQRASRLGSNLFANSRLVQLARRVRIAGTFASPEELLGQMS